MARKINRDEHRNPVPGFPQAKPADAGQAQIWMSPELKEAAKQLQNSWDISHDEQMASLNIRDVNLKFASDEQRAAFLQALEKLARLTNPNFPTTYPLPAPTELPAGLGDGVWINFWHNYFLPPMFDGVMQDVAGTELDTIPAKLEILRQAKACLAAYEIAFVRMDVVVEEGADRSVVDSLTGSLREAHSRLRKFLQLLVKSLPERGVSRVVILDQDRFEVDGMEKVRFLRFCRHGRGVVEKKAKIYATNTQAL